MTKYGKLAAKSSIPQTEPLDERQVPNNSGGFVYALDMWKRLDRFIILGSDAPTYYQNAQKLTRENAKNVEACLVADPTRTIARVVEISTDGRAPKNDPAIFVLALAVTNADVKVRAAAYLAVPKVCRTATHLFQFIATARELGKGWGPGLRKAVARWYDEKAPADVAYQAVKYRERNGYTHQRLLNSAHPKGNDSDPARKALYGWLTPTSKGKEISREALPPIIVGFERAQKETDALALAGLVLDYRLPWEAVPTQFHGSAVVWRAAFDAGMGYTALLRNLGRFSRLEMLKPLSEFEMLVRARLTNPEDIRKSRVHPMQILTAMKIYGQGRGDKGDSVWPVNPKIVSALEDAFYLSFKNVTPAGVRTFIALDVSGSMSSPFGGGAMSCCEVTAAMAMVSLRTEPRTYVRGFSTGLVDLGITEKSSLRDAVRRAQMNNFGGTDCSLPMMDAIKQKLEVDVFVVYTDSETYAGRSHPVEELRKYRKQSGIDAKLIVVGITSTGFSIADPKDPGMLDVVGFDSAAPKLISDFGAGRI